MRSIHPLLIGAIALGTSLSAQGAGAVPLGDAAYRAIDRLVSAGLIDTILLGQRPYSRRQMLGLVLDARRNAPRSMSNLLVALEQRFLDDKRFAVDAIGVSVTSTNSTPRFVPADPGLGDVDAVISPLALAAQPGGRDAMRGTTFALETRHHVSLGTNAAVDLQPRVRAATASSLVGERAVSLQTAVFSARLANVGVSVGREHVAWGQGRRAGLLFSGGGPPLDILRVGTDRPWVLPGWLRAVGPSAVSLVVADLGSRQYFPHTTLVGYKWSAKPNSRLELGAGALDFVGGRGAPAASLGKKVANLILFPALPTKGYEFSNTMVGLEARYRFGRSHVYWEMNLDDFDARRVRSSAWTDDAAHLLGLTLPRLGDAGRTALTLEAHHTGTRFGRHFQFRSGAAANHFLLGDPLGPNASGQYAFVDHDLDGNRSIAFELANESYSNDQHAISQSPFAIHLVERRPRERRLRALVAFRRAPLTSGAALMMQAGLERTGHFAFADHDTRVEALASVSLSYVFRQ